MILAQMLANISYCVLQGSLQQEVSGITEYSGDVRPGMVYCCIRGRHADGHHLASEAVRLGASVLVTERPVAVKDSSITVIQVADTRQAAGVLAGAFYGYPSKKMRMIGITGTKGKTTMSYMIQSVFQQAGIPCGVIGTNGCRIGEEAGQQIFHTTPGACVLQKLLADMAEAGCRAAVLEVSSIGLKEKRCSGILFDYGIFTNFASDHIGGAEHSSLEEYLYWKIQLFSQCRRGIVNLDEPVSREILRKGKAQEWIGYGLNPPETEQIARLYKGSNLNIWAEDHALGIEFQAAFSGNASPIDIRIPMPGAYNASNALGAVVCGLEDGCSDQSVKTALEEIRVPGRTEVIGTFHGAKIMVDYAHNASGLEKLLLALKEYHPARIICVFGCGGNRSRLRRTEMGEVSSRLADIVVLTEDNSRGENPEEIIAEIRHGMEKEISCHTVLDRKAAIQYALELSGPGDFVVVAGKGHEAYQEKNGVRYPFSDREVIEEIIFGAHS